MRPQLTIVDAVTAMEGDGPIMGRPRTLGFVAMGTDLPAVDATCARIIGLDPWKIEYLSKADGHLGHIDDGKIEQRGEKPSRYATRFDVIKALEGLRLASWTAAGYSATPRNTARAARVEGLVTPRGGVRDLTARQRRRRFADGTRFLQVNATANPAFFAAVTAASSKAPNG